MITPIAAERLINQRLTRSGPRTADALVAWFGGVQAQDYASARWALAMRMRGSTTAGAIDRALDQGRIIRTHVLRPTWHLVAAEDVGWMLALTAERVQQRLAFAYRNLGLDSATRVRAASQFERALRDGAHLTRREGRVR